MSASEVSGSPTLPLRYGLNPHQTPAIATPIRPGDQPVRLVYGEPSYLNLLDALTGWQLVREATAIFGRPAAASVKHASPAGAALAGDIDAATTELYGADHYAGPVTSAYLRARDADPKSSYGDLAAVSAPVDAELADALTRLACDGIIAPSYEDGVVERLSGKKNGRFLILAADLDYEPPVEEVRELYGLRLVQPADRHRLRVDQLSPVVGDPPAMAALDDILFGLVVLRYTQSNSVAYVRDGAALGVGAGQQSRIDCTRLAGAKTDLWWLRRHPDVRGAAGDGRIQERIARQLAYLDSATHIDRASWLAGLDRVSVVSDAAFPFADNIEEAVRHGVRYVGEPGGSIRSADVEAACRRHGVSLIRTGIRLFRH